MARSSTATWSPSSAAASNAELRCAIGVANDVALKALLAQGKVAREPGDMPDPETGEPVLVTREEILEHAEADGRVLDADLRYQERQARWHRRLISALRPYGDRSTSVGKAFERAARVLGVERNGRSFEEFAGLVVAAAEARSSA